MFTQQVPATYEELCVALDLDSPAGEVVAGWRDAYVAEDRSSGRHVHAPHVERCLDFLRDGGLCWDCGRPALSGPMADPMPGCSLHPPDRGE